MESLSHTTAHLLMVEPVAFGFNAETAANNYFQQHLDHTASEIQAKALHEFRTMVNALTERGIDVTVIQDTPTPCTPDSIFPNNWISFHPDCVALYPMFAENRRAERRLDLLQTLAQKGFTIPPIHDFTQFEASQQYFEGTGAMVLDRTHQIAYICLSDRADEAAGRAICEQLHLVPLFFHANQWVGKERLPIYHTNVMMSVADDYAVICLDSMDTPDERKAVTESLSQHGKEVITISEEQMHHFAGNMLQVKNQQGERFLVMSASAHASLTDAQKQALTAHNPLLPVDITTIETIGGGSARCMMAEVFLPRA